MSGRARRGAPSRARPREREPGFMRRFRFSMQGVLDMRREEQRRAELELGRAAAEVTRIQRELDTVSNRKAAAVKEFNTAHDVELQAGLQTYFFMLDRKRDNFLAELSAAEREVDAKRETVRQARRKVEVLEKLRETQAAEWARENEKAEELASDDIITAKNNRRRS